MAPIKQYANLGLPPPSRVLIALCTCRARQLSMGLIPSLIEPDKCLPH